MWGAFPRSVILSESSSLQVGEIRALLEPWAKEDERRKLRDVLMATDGDKDLAAQRLGISRRTLQRRIRTFDLEGFPQYRER